MTVVSEMPLSIFAVNSVDYENAESDFVKIRQWREEERLKLPSVSDAGIFSSHLEIL